MYRCFYIFFFLCSTVFSQSTIEFYNGRKHPNNNFTRYIKKGQWAPLQIAITTSTAPFEGHCKIEVHRVKDKIKQFYYLPLKIPIKSSKKYTYFIQIPRSGFIYSYLYQKKHKESEKAVSPAMIIDNNHDLLLIIAGKDSFLDLDHSVLQKLNYYRTIDNAWSRRAVWLDNKNMYENWLGYRGYAAIVIDAHSPRDWNPLSFKKWIALRRYIESGGTLFICGGQLTHHLKDKRLLELLPVNLEQEKNVYLSIPEYRGIRSLTKIPVLNSSPKRGAKILWQVANTPILVEKKMGMGKILFFAASMASHEFKQLPKRPYLYFGTGPKDHELNKSELASYVLEHKNKPVIDTTEFSEKVSKKIHKKLLELTALPIPSTTYIILFLTFYLLLIIPCNYLFWKKLKRPIWSWITGPAIAIVFVYFVYLTGYLAVDNPLTGNNFTLVQSTVNSNRAKAHHHMALFSKVRHDYRLEMGNDSYSMKPFYFEKDTALLDNASLTLEYNKHLIVRKFPMFARTVRNMEAVGLVDMNKGIAVERLHYQNPTLQIKITNNTSFNFRHCWIVLGNMINKEELSGVKIGNFASGGTIDRREDVRALPKNFGNRRLFPVLQTLFTQTSFTNLFNQGTPLLIGITNDNLLNLKGSKESKLSHLNLFVVNLEKLSGKKVMLQYPKWLWCAYYNGIRKETIVDSGKKFIKLQYFQETVVELYLLRWKDLLLPWIEDSQRSIKITFEKKDFIYSKQCLIHCYNFSLRVWKRTLWRGSRELILQTVKDYICPLSGRILIRFNNQKTGYFKIRPQEVAISY